MEKRNGGKAEETGEGGGWSGVDREDGRRSIAGDGKAAAAAGGRERTFWKSARSSDVTGRPWWKSPRFYDALVTREALRAITKRGSVIAAASFAGLIAIIALRVVTRRNAITSAIRGYLDPRLVGEESISRIIYRYFTVSLRFHLPRRSPLDFTRCKNSIGNAGRKHVRTVRKYIETCLSIYKRLSSLLSNPKITFYIKRVKSKH